MSIISDSIVFLQLFFPPYTMLENRGWKEKDQQDHTWQARSRAVFPSDKPVDLTA